MGWIVGLALTHSVGAAEWQEIPGARWKALEIPTNSRTGFQKLPSAETRIGFTNFLAIERFTTNQIYLNGSGVTAGDIDGDGRTDLFFGGLGGGSRLYRNLGSWKFEDATTPSGLAAICAGLDVSGVLLVDADGDGDLDLILNTVGQGTQWVVNDGTGHFSVKQVMNPGKGAMSMAMGDMDGDGRLDLYVANYRQTTLRDHPRTNFRINMVDGKPMVATVDGRPSNEPDLIGRYTFAQGTGITEHGEADAYFRGGEQGTFVPVPFTGGTFLDESGKPLSADQYDWGLSVMVRDLDGDGLPDIYVCNDFASVDRVWMNSGRGVLRAIAPTLLRNTSKFSMGIDVADVNRDGFDDLFVVDMQSRSHRLRATRMDKGMETTPVGVIENRPQLARNTLHLARGDGTYAEIAHVAGLDSTEWSWTPIFLDVDLDGFEDLLVTAGHGRDDMDLDSGLKIEAAKRASKMSVPDQLRLRMATPALPQAKSLYRNLGGARFEEVGREWGFGDEGVAHGMCLADLDNDGDMDVVVNQLNGAAGVYRNEAGGARVAVRLKGEAPNTRGIGAKIRVLGGAVGMQSQEMIAGGRYLSGDEAMRVFAAGTTTHRMRIEVDWRSGKRSVVEGVEANRVYEIAESGATKSEVGRATNRIAALFTDASERLGHVHREPFHDDFEKQALLPRRLSQLGPGVGFMDLDGDGNEDVVIGSGKGGSLAGYLGDGRGGFRRMEGMPWVQMTGRDQTGIVGWRRGDGTLWILSGTANYEDGVVGGSSVRVYDLGTKRVEDAVPAWEGSAGPLALGGLAKDGSLSLLVGGRVNVGGYPKGSESRVYANREGKWELDAENTRALKDVGMVSGAVWTDLDGDGWSELVLACEWGPVRVFRNAAGRLEEATEQWGLSGRVGWWNGVGAGDFDGDGRMDLVVSNWGLNTGYRASAEEPRRLYVAAVGGGTESLMEAWKDRTMGKWVPEVDRDALGKEWPWVTAKYPLHRSYAEASVEEILGDIAKSARVLEANWLETTVFLNRGGHFETGKLPMEAQWSPGFGVSVADFDGDGNEDVFVSQNFFAVPGRTSRSDAGRGLVLRGNGRGGFEAMSGQESGVKVYGEQRGSAVGDYDGDGRVDLLVSQNGGETKLYRNEGGKVGVRVRLKGPGNNPEGIGAVVQLGSGDGKWGAAREVHAGSGYWSMDSVVTVMARPEGVRRIGVRWPGNGKRVESELPEGAREVVVHPDGTVEAKR